MRPVLSLSGLGRGLLLLVLAGLAALLAWHFAPRFRGLADQVAVAGQGQQRVAWRVITYRLDPVRPTVFRFSQPLAELRIISQPVVAPQSVAPGKHWIYSVEVELLDSAANVIGTQTIHARSMVLEADGTRRGPVRYYRGRPEAVAPADEFHLAGDRPVAAIRVRAGQADQGVVAIDLRISEQRPLIESAAESAFARYSPADRQRLAAASAFPPEMLSREERMAIARSQWRPIGPIGIEGRDYTSNVLYEEEESPPQPTAPAPAGRAGR